MICTLCDPVVCLCVHVLHVHVYVCTFETCAWILALVMWISRGLN